jgi:hypothetical protein
MPTPPHDIHRVHSNGLQVGNRQVSVALEEGVGFEPTRARALAVFKTAAFDRSATPPQVRENN